MVRIIHLEDNLYDQELVAEMLSSAEIECEIIHVRTIINPFQTAKLDGTKGGSYHFRFHNARLHRCPRLATCPVLGLHIGAIHLFLRNHW